MTLKDLAEAFGTAFGRAAASSAKDQRDRAYQDRNLLAVAYAVEIARADWGNGGYYYAADDETSWPLVWASTIHGQQSWHVKPELEELLAESPLEESEPPQGYDGHSRTEKNQRLVQQVAAGGGNRL